MPAITIDIPDPLFQKGDVIQSNELILHVWRVEATGHWGYVAGEELKTWMDFLNGYSYACTVQTGNTLEGPVRPGTVLCFSESSLLTNKASKIPWNKEIISPDDNQNYKERKDRWQRSAQETQH